MSRTYLVEQVPVDEQGEFDGVNGTMKFVVTWHRAYELTGEGSDGADQWVHMPDEDHATHWMFADIFDTKSEAEACRAAK